MSDFAELTPIIARRLAQNQRIRRNLPGGGRVRIDRQLPFLCVYRQPPNRPDEGSPGLVTTEAAYLFASGAAEYHTGLAHLCRTIVETLHEHFGAFLLFELWTTPEEEIQPATRLRPAFEIVTAEDSLLSSTVESLKQALSEIRLHGSTPEITERQVREVAPPDLPPLVEQFNPKISGCARIGLQIKPVYRAVGGGIFPLLLQALQRQLGPALRKAVYAFTGVHPERQPASYQSFGPSTMVKATRLVDQRLCNISQAFDFLLQATPVNSGLAWRQFAASNYERVTRLRYRPLPYHPNLLKRQLFEIPIEQIEDVTLAQLFWEKQDELDRQLTALRDLDTPNFLHSSQQLYGQPSRELVELALSILAHPAHDEDSCERSTAEETIADRLPRKKGSKAKRTRSSSTCATAEEVAEIARQEIDYYHQRLPSFAGTVHFDDHIASGMMVAKEQLLISPALRVSRKRVLPLIHHEVGTHLLTYHNGRAQPLQQLYAGLAGYEPLQEGLAVLAEYLTGGLSAQRLKHLAARVIAVHACVEQASFIETFRLLRKEHDLPAEVAFNTTLRAYRGGGMTKDALYLLGLRDLLAYLAQGHDLEPLYVGKIALQHVPAIQELRLRGIVQPPALLPRFWQADAAARQQLDYCRRLTVLDMLQQPPPSDVTGAEPARDKEA